MDILQYIQKNYTVTIVSLIAILVIMGVQYNATAYQNQCNQHWTEQMKRCSCACIIEPDQFNTPFKYQIPGLENGSQNTNPNP